MGKKIAIVGTTASLVDAPYDDESWEIWGLNGAYKAMKRWDMWFDLHDLDVLKKIHQPEYFPFLANAGNKLMLNAKTDEFPDAGVFPYQELASNYRKYFTNTVSWLIAYAMEQEDIEEIGIWGVNMAQDTEYGKQRPSCEYFLGLAEGRGIKVTIPESSEILKASHLYGVEPIPAIMAKVPDKLREMKISQTDVLKELEEKKGELNFINGYLQGVLKSNDYDTKKKYDDAKPMIIAEKQNRASQLNNEISEYYDKKAYWQGAMDLMQYYVVNWG